MARLSPALWCATCLVASSATAILAAVTNGPVIAASAVGGEVKSVPAASQQALQQKVKELWQRQYELEHADPEIARVRKDIVELERQLVARRKDLAERLARKPEIQQLEQERLALVRQVQTATPAVSSKP